MALSNPIDTGGFSNPGIGTAAPPRGDGTAGSIGVEVFRVSFTKAQADSVLKVFVYCNLYSPDDLQFVAYVGIDGIVKQVGVINLILDTTASKSRAPLPIIYYGAGIAAGAHVITFSVLNREPDGPLTIDIGTTIEVTEIKNSAM